LEAPLSWPKTRLGRVVLVVSVVYAAFWLAFSIAPEFKATVLSIPYLGPALNAFFALYVAVLLLWLLWWALWN
jgi:hypothetical protein